MKISEMLYDSAKYPFSGIKQLLLLGLMLLVISFLLGDYNDIYFYVYNDFGPAALLSMIMLFFLIVTILVILEAGYTFKIIEKSVQQIEKPPKLNGIISMFKHGFNEIIIAIIYFIVPFIILLGLLDEFFSQIDLGFPPISDETAILLIISAIILGFIADIIFTVAIPHMASNGGKFKEAFNFPAIFRKIKKIGFKKLFIGYIIVILGIVLIGGPILKEILESANIFGFLVAEELLAPYIIMFSARFTALIYMESL
ncbi:MAG TPA: DUF4013 domain-containing protein [Methanobacterium sp.]|nr:DUF4013 domain-containing protein [Methanobacterium sp.]